MQRTVSASATLDGSTPPATSVAHPTDVKLGPAEWALLLLHSVLWGSSFFFIDIAKAELPVFTINALRLVPAAGILLTIVALKRMPVGSAFAHWRALLLLGIFNNALPLVLIIYAQATVSGGLAAVFIATTPMFSLLLAHAVTGDERLTANKIAGLLLGVAGVAILTGSGQVDATVLPKVALVIAAASYALAGAFTRGLRGIPPLVLAASQMTTSLMISLPVALIVDRPWTLPTPSLAAIGAVLGSGVFGSALAAICYFTIISRAGATNALLVTLLIPLTPITLGAALLGQQFHVNELIGAVVIALALLVVDGRILSRARTS